MSLNSLSVVALAWREGEQVKECLASCEQLVRAIGARTLVVLDERADEATSLAARQSAHRVVTRRFDNFAAQRNFALEVAQTEWVFFIDPDERATSALCDEIATAVRSEACDAWRVPRRNIIVGREVRHSGWWPDYQIRLLRRAVARYDHLRPVHEVPIVPGEVCTLLSPLIHYNYTSWAQFATKQRAYAPLEAELLHLQGVKARRRSLIGQPVREFLRRYFEMRGWRDGMWGVILAGAMAAYRFDVYRRLLALQTGEKWARG